MNDKYSHIKIDKYVIMPNHFHLILHIIEYKNGALETVAPYHFNIIACGRTTFSTV